MTWRDTWRETVESFLREVGEPTPAGTGSGAGDPVVAAIAEARAEVAAVERELAIAQARHAAETEATELCARRRTQAERIGDADTARIAARFGGRHAARAQVYARKFAVLEEELALARAALNDLLDYARAETKPPTDSPR